MQSPSQSLKSIAMLIIIAVAASLAHAGETTARYAQETVMVGRISHVEGVLSRFDPDTETWAETTLDAPFGIDDVLQSETDSKAEIVLPNNTWLRIDGDTSIRLMALDTRHTEYDCAFGRSRLINKSEEAEIVARTPFGTISAPPESSLDLDVFDNAVEIIALDGTVYFTHDATRIRHAIHSDASGLLADAIEVTATAGEVGRSWYSWNQQMDDLWAVRLASRGQSSDYLPPALHSEAYALDTHGRWETVHYNGGAYRFWRPIHVSVGWAPFTSGTWMLWHGDHVWLPREPFGYVTHHYGNWIFTAGYWYWAPPVTRVMRRARLPLMSIGFGWYPGRVAWIHSRSHIGWIPLAPHEPYYAYWHRGRRFDRLAGGTAHVHRPIRHYKHHRHTVAIHRDRLYRSQTASHVRGRRSPPKYSAGGAVRPVPAPRFKKPRAERPASRGGRFTSSARSHRWPPSIAADQPKTRWNDRPRKGRYRQAHGGDTRRQNQRRGIHTVRKERQPHNRVTTHKPDRDRRARRLSRQGDHRAKKNAMVGPGKNRRPRGSVQKHRSNTGDHHGRWRNPGYRIKQRQQRLY